MSQVWIDSYPFDHLSKVELEAQAARKIADKLLLKEPSLMRTKWFDYRRLHPAAATAMYAEFYIQAYQRAIKKYHDIRDAERGARPWKEKSPFMIRKATLTGLWKGRQLADELGMPYGLFCFLAMEILYGKFMWQKPPRPAQVYGDDVLVEIVDMWVERRNARLFYAETDYFAMKNYTGSEIQIAHQDWLVSQIGNRGNHSYPLSFVLYDRPMLSEEKAEKAFGKETVLTARSLSDI